MTDVDVYIDLPLGPCERPQVTRLLLRPDPGGGVQSAWGPQER